MLSQLPATGEPAGWCLQYGTQTQAAGLLGSFGLARRPSTGCFRRLPPVFSRPLWRVRRRPLSCCNARLGWFGVVALVLLRMTVGWHILYEGVWKLEQAEFSSEGYLGMASGPFEHYFQYEVLQDFEANGRLAPPWHYGEMDDYHRRFVEQFPLDAQQRALADRILTTRKNNVRDTLENAENQKLIRDYAAAWKKLNDKKQAVSEDKAGAPFEKQRIWEATQKLRGEARPWLAAIDAQHDGLRTDLKKLLPTGQQDVVVSYSFVEQFRDRDRMVTYACVAIGFCLLAGLFSRLAGLGGFVFLALVVAAKLEWPGYYAPPAHPSQGHSLIINKEFIEMMACLVLAAIPTGRWGGLDFFIHRLIVAPFCSKKD